MDINHNLIKGCPLCDIFSNEKISTLYFPDSINSVNNVDFVIINLSLFKSPLVVIRDHVPTISSSLWGNILYTCKKLFKKNVKLKIINKVEDHWCALIEDE